MHYWIRSSVMALMVALLGLAVAGAPAFADERNPHRWNIHDGNRPQPPQMDPGPYVGPLPAPEDAIVLFDGSNFDHWQHHDGSEPEWELVDDDAMRIVPESGDIRTRESFGDAQLYIEYKIYEDSPGEGQSRSNSGVFFGSYEVQVLDSYDNPTYPDGMNASIYGQYPPLVNVSRPPGEWQTYNIIYIAPRFDEHGVVEEPARITVIHNGVLVQHAEELIGPTSHANRQHYTTHGDVPIRLQDHRDDPMQFRNIWIRELNGDE